MLLRGHSTIKLLQRICWDKRGGGGVYRKSEGVSLNLKSSSQMKIVETLKTTLGQGKKRNEEYVKYFSLEQFCLLLFKPVFYWLSINCRFYPVTSQYLAARFTKTVLFWTKKWNKRMTNVSVYTCKAQYPVESASHGIYILFVLVRNLTRSFSITSTTYTRKYGTRAISWTVKYSIFM